MLRPNPAVPTAVLTAALLPLLAVRGLARDEEAWLARLPLPRLVQIDSSFQVHDADLGIRGYELGFPDHPERMVVDAKERIDAGERSARVLHQAALGFSLLEESEPLQELVPACLQVYAQELEEHPRDFDRRMGFANALELAGMLSGEESFFFDARSQLGVAAEIDPGSWHPGFSAASMFLTRYFAASQAGRAEPGLLDGALVWARQAVTAAPDEPAPRWRLFLCRYLKLTQGAPRPLAEVCSEIGVAADELRDAVAEAPGGGRLRMCADAFWLVSRMLMLLEREPGAEGHEAGDQVIRARLAGLVDELWEMEEGSPFGAKLARVAWSLHVLVGDPEQHERVLGLCLRLGLEPEEALGFGLVQCQRQGQSEVAARLAARLETRPRGDLGEAALAKYRYQIGELEGSLEALEELADAPNAGLARGVVLLKLGRRAPARAALTAVLGERPEDALARYALGVAMALDGELEPAAAELRRAVEEIGADSPAGATLAEVEALLRKG